MHAGVCVCVCAYVSVCVCVCVKQQDDKCVVEKEAGKHILPMSYVLHRLSLLVSPHSDTG